MKTAHKFKVRSAFTLIEILVVVAIIAVIAAILFPVFSRARENARRSNCQSNLKQISLGILQYVQDFDNRFPKQAFNLSAPPRGWSDAIFPYTKSLQLLQCPSEATASNPDPASLAYTDYAFNANLSAKQESQLSQNTSTILISEGISFSSEQPKDGNDAPTFATAACEGDSTFPGATPGIHRLLQPGQLMHPDVSRHFSGGSYAFADGHVKWLLPEKIHNWCTAPNANATFAYR